MPGIISGFVKGAGEAAAEAGKMQLAAQIRSEMDEANALRDAELRRGLQQERQAYESGEAEAERKFTTSEREAKQDFEAGQAKLERESTERMATTKAESTAGGKGSTTNIKNAQWLIQQGVPAERAMALSMPGGFKTITDADTGDILVLNAVTDEPLGRLTNVGTRGDKHWVSDSNAELVVEPTLEDREQLAAEVKDKDSGWFTNWKKEYGVSKAQWEKMRLQEIARQNAAKRQPATPAPTGGGGGLVNRQMQQPTPAAPATPEPRFVGGAKYPEGTELRKGGKVYIVQNGKPVLKQGQ